ncbi:MAG: PstS family phosphate ABC transporter substrate-binding protein [Actinobacteria bacterium]|nr:PstS family phosphate ABC transporter substrate-binding protein [Actinomycetota bacterium]
MELFSSISKKSKLLIITAFSIVIALAVIGCSSGTQTESPGDNTNSTEKLSGTIKIDGSSTVLPISEAVAEEFMRENQGVNVTVGSSGTGGGFKKFVSPNNPIDVNDASRPIKDTEQEAARQNGIEYIEIPVAYDGISIIVNKENTWAKSITTEELKKIWEPGSKIKTWKEVRPDWPDTKLSLFGPSSAHGTFDYFTETINGKEKAIRTDYNVSEEYNTVVQGVAADKGSLGFLGYAYYKQNEGKLNVLGVDGGSGSIEPSEETIKDGSYKPLARPIFIYVSKKALDRLEVKEFVRFYLTEGPSLISDVGYIPLNDADYEGSLNAIK